ncbi:MAG TPA: hypothetical protein ENK19_09520 [Acidobacteria bacterium]|nr:hypothetical protein [Acidobacteriota bacterium]
MSFRGRTRVWVFWACLAAAGALGAGEPPYHWHINVNGRAGTLDISTGKGDQISGTALGAPIDGWLVARHLVFMRHGETGDELWEGWIATPAGHGEGPIIAGKVIRSGEAGALPWFGTTQLPAAGANSSSSRADSEGGSKPAVSPPAVPPSEASHESSASTIAPRLETGQPALAGVWMTPDGPLRIRQHGSRLIFVLPDREVLGRLTGPDSLIGGFAPGCCKGHLEQAFTVIAWDNGTRWYRK